MGGNDLKLGQKLILTFDNEKVMGTLKLLKEDHLRLTAVTDFMTKEKIGNNCIYYLAGIRNINIVTEDGVDNGAKANGDTLDKTNSSSSGVGSEKRVQDKVQTIRIPEDVLVQLTDALRNIRYIKVCDHTYFDAIKDIKKQRTIGLSIEDVGAGRESKHPAFLTIATDKCVYVIDLITLKKVNIDFKEILESKHIQKVVYYSKYMIDFMKNVWKIRFNNFFDISVSSPGPYNLTIY